MAYIYSVYTVAFLLSGKPNCSFELFKSKIMKGTNQIKKLYGSLEDYRCGL